jgi:hypothetical protein
MPQPRTGGCLCGAIRYETVGDPVFTLRCHCRDCQRQSGAAHVPAARVPSGGFRILQGTPRRYVTQADSGNEIVRVFCGDCGTPLYVQVATRPDLIGLRVCTLDDAGWFPPGGRHLHAERAALGSRRVRRAAIRRLPAGTILSRRNRAMSARCPRCEKDVRRASRQAVRPGPG